jgi:hypothetical protein
VEFATAGIDDKVFVAKYLVALPIRKTWNNLLERNLKTIGNKRTAPNDAT